jgi:hypothetical protein
VKGRSAIVLACLALWTGARAAAAEETDGMVAGARTVLASIVRAAGENHDLPERGKPGARGPFRRSGDELTEYYVRAAARSAREVPAEQRAAAFLLAIGVALDDSDLLRKNLITGPLWRRVESDEERKGRLRVLGEPKVHGRHDLAQHFGVSAALTAVNGEKAAEAAGILKEMLDSRRGGSGFSFADLAADLSGIAFAAQMLKSPEDLARVASGFTVADHALPPDGLPEGLTQAEFARQYGSTSDERFTSRLESIRKRVGALPGYRPRTREKPDQP